MHNILLEIKKISNTNIVKYILCSIVFLMYSSFCIGQQKINSLFDSLNKVKNMDQRIEVLYLIGTEYTSSEPEKAEKYLLAGISLSNTNNLKILESRGYSGLGTLNYYKSEYSKAITNFKKALELSLQGGDSLIAARQYSNLGAIYDVTGNYFSAAKSYYQALKIFEASDDKSGKAFVYNNLGIVFYEIQQPKQSLKFYQLAYKYKKALNDTLGMASTLNNIGNLYEAEFNLPEIAGKYFKQSLSLYITKGNLYGKAYAMHNLAKTLNNLQNNTEAITLFEKALAIRTQIGDIKGQLSSKHMLAKLYLKTGKTQKAQDIIIACATLADSLKNLQDIYEVNTTLSEIYEKTGNYKKAVDVLKSLKIISDSLAGEKTREKISELNILYETEKKEKAISKLEDKQKLDSQKRIILSLLLATSIIILALLLLFFRQRQKILKARNQQLKKEKELIKIEYELKENELKGITQNMTNQMAILHSLQNAIDTLTKENDVLLNSMQPLNEIILESLISESGWESFQLRFEQVYPKFFTSLKNISDQITNNDLRLCALLRLNLSSKEIANLQNTTIDAVNKSRNRLRKKLNLEPAADLNSYLNNF